MHSHEFGIDDLQNLLQQTIWLMVLLSAPILITDMLLGILISIFQAVTQIQEQTLTFVPKIFATFLIFLLTAGWMVDQLLGFSNTIFDTMIHFGH
jgi:flagellar biosynthetic protein FliQ